jgi:uncharacterized protein YllA (UPF0747 family)
MVLPDVACVGGGAEVTYMLQLKTLFDALEVSFPIVFLRNSVLWIDQNNLAKLSKLGVSQKEIFEPAEMLV